MPEILIVVIYLTLGILPLKPLTTLLHELGHATPALLFSRNKEVKVYIGSYGDAQKSYNLKIGRLVLLMHPNPLRWYKGMCEYPAETMSINRRIVVVLMGPATTLLVAILAGWLIFGNEQSHGLLRFAGLGLLIVSVLELIANLIPRINAVILDNGTRVSNDGGNIVTLMQLKKTPHAQLKALEYYSKADYGKALEIFDPVTEGLKSKLAIYAMVHCLYQEQRYEEALSLYRRMEQRFRPNNEDLYLLSLIKYSLNDFEGAIRTSLLLLSSNPKHVDALNNTGYYFTCLKQYDHAVQFLTKALKINPDHAFVNNNMGLALIKTGKTEEGLKHIEQSLALDDTNGWAYRNKGIYCLETGDKQTALIYLEKARTLQADIPDLETLILAAT